MVISLAMIALQAVLSVALILLSCRAARLADPMWQATGPGDRADAGAGLRGGRQGAAAVAAARRPVSGWRWPLIWAAAAAVVVGQLVILLPEWAELIVRHPARSWLRSARCCGPSGFGPEDRELFRMRKADIEELSLPDPATGGDAPR